ncbi:MAG: M48 family peptidase [Acidobacteria bacterium]|nr:M48 family peptidase [Acidobacteriota bacterium]
MTSAGMEIFERVHLAVRPRTPLPEIALSFRPYADINNVIRMRAGRMEVSLSDLLEGSPPPVLESIAYILISKLYRKPIPPQFQARYRQFLNRSSVRHQAQIIRRVRGRKHVGVAAGSHFHLDEMFEDLNQRYFGGLMARPSLGWSRTASRVLLGHFDSAHNAIIVSRIFDRPQTPLWLVEYILYHEMLHLKYPVLHRGTRRCVHSSEFRAEEQRFPQYAEAKELLKQL